MESEHDSLCPRAVWSDSAYVHCQCHLIGQAKAIERMRLIDLWREEGHDVMFNKAHDDLTPSQRVFKWLRNGGSHG